MPGGTAGKTTSRTTPTTTGAAAATPATKARGSRRAPVDLAQAILQAAATNERMNQFLLEDLDERAWTAKPAQGRTIAAIVSHIHNVRHMWLVVSAKDFPAPLKLDRKSVTIAEARTALGESSVALQGLLSRALDAGGRVKDFRPDVVSFLSYLVAHEAHHRGQICLLARELGMPLSKNAGYGLWDWNKRWQECGFSA